MHIKVRSNEATTHPLTPLLVVGNSHVLSFSECALMAKKRRRGAVAHEIEREQRPESQAYQSFNTENANTSWVILSEA